MLATAGGAIAKEELAQRRRSAAGLRRARREMDAAALPEAEGGYTTGRKRTGVRLTYRGGLPESVWGRVFTGAAFLAMACLVSAGAILAQHLAQRDQRFLVTTPAAVAIDGLHHLSRAEVLATMSAAPGGLVGRNIFRVSLVRERAQLEGMPWVEHASVMRLLPDRLRASITERTPVAFARNGRHIGLVDASGVLLDMGAGAPAEAHYSFPVVTGISPADPLSMRSSRMKIYGEFTAALDATGEHISSRLSEVDLSNPEDVKALVPENGSDVMVHFGDAEYLERFRRFERLLPEWRAQYPKLAGVDMRYERQVVLEMQPGAGTAAEPAAGAKGIAPSNAVAARPDAATAHAATRQAEMRAATPAAHRAAHGMAPARAHGRRAVAPSRHRAAVER